MKYLSLWVCILTFGCTGGETPIGGTETGNTLSAAVASVFNSQEQSVRLVKPPLPIRIVSLLIREAVAGTAAVTHPTSACNLIPPKDNNILFSRSLQAGTYGVTNSVENFVTLNTNDGCDQGGLYASFHILSAIMTCTDSLGGKSSVTMTDSSGVFKETSASSQIYGTFNLSSDGSSAVGIQCHITVNHTEGSDKFSAVCTDSLGNSVTQATDVSCMGQ